MKSSVGIPKTSAYVAQGAPPQDPPYFKNIDAQVKAAAAPYMQSQNASQPTDQEASPGLKNAQPGYEDVQQSLQNEIQKQQAYDKANTLLNMANRNNPNIDQTKDHDAEPHGFDTSDKMSMLGALAVGGGVGAAEIGARAVQLLTKASRTGSYVDIMGKDFTDWFNRQEARSTLIQEAIASHPTVYEIGKVGGNIAGTAAATAGVGAVAGAIAKGAGMVAEAAPEIGAGIDSAMAAIKSATTNGAAKAVLNSKLASTALKIANISGKGAVIGELQYDPENNHFLNQATTGAIYGLAFHGAGNLIKNLASPIASAIKKVAQKYNISLPIYPTLEKIASYIPFSGYAKTIQDRAQQVAAAGEGIAAPIIKQGRSAMLKDLGARAQALTKQLSAEGLNDYDKGVLQKSLDSIKEQRDLVGTAAGYNEFLGGKLKQSLEQAKDETAKLYSKVDKQMDGKPFVEMPKTLQVAQEINNEQQDIVAALRKPALDKITSSLYQDNNVKQKLIDAGIDDPGKFSDVINGILGNKSISGQAYQAAAPYMEQITKALEGQGLATAPIDFSDPVQQLAAKVRLDYQAFRSNMQEVGSRISNAISPKDNGNFKRLYGAMSQDLKDHVQTHGGKDAIDAFNLANKIHQERVAPFYNAPLNAYRSDDFNADNFIGKFFKPDEVTKASNILQKMPVGENSAHLAAKAAIMNEAMTRAQIPGVGFNPMKFVQQVKSLGETNNIVFSKAENAAFDGYEKLVNTVHRISRAAVEPGTATGMTATENVSSKLYQDKRLLTEIGGGAAVAGIATGHAAITLPLVASAWGFGRLMTSQAGRNLMVKLSNLGEAAAADKVNPIVKEAVKLIGLYGGMQSAVTIGRGL